MVVLAPNVSAVGIAIDDTNVYWTDAGPPGPNGGFGGPGAIMKVSKSGGPSVTVAGGQRSSIGGVALDASGVYWVNGRDVMSAPK